MKKSDDYAGNQVRIFLGNLKNGAQPVRLKAVQQFQNYIQTFVPNITDDNVDFLFTGNLDGKSTLGLLHFCGVESEKHEGQLKRICAPAITLLHWLVTFEGDSIYFDRFIRLPKEVLAQINFPKHILQPNEANKLTSLTRTKTNTDDSVFELLSILLHDHRSLDDELEAVDIPFLLRGSKVCQDRLEDWLQKANLEHINETLELLKAGGQGGQAVKKGPSYPAHWSAVNFKCVPLQEGEEIGTAEMEEGSREPPPIADPLGVRDIDLREAQRIFSTGGLQQTGPAGRRNSISADPMHGVSFSSPRTKTVDDEDDDFDGEDEEEDDDELAPNRQFFRAVTRNRRTAASVLPGDKNFSTSTFLSLVHGKTSFDELKRGLGHLQEQLQQQSRRRENLVRTHFGLFVQCADGLEWLKAFRQGESSASQSAAPSAKPSRPIPINPFAANSTATAAVSRGNNNNNGTSFVAGKGMERLRKAHDTLEYAKAEARRTLAPILERMKHGREIRSAEKVLRGMFTVLEYPYRMKKALERGEFKEVIAVYQRVLSVPANSSLKLVPKVKKAADAVLNDLKKQCLTQLFSPSFNYAELNKHAQILLELEGLAQYAQVLKQCFVRQLLHWLSLCRDAKHKFVADCLEAFDKGQELNILSRTASHTPTHAHSGVSTDSDSVLNAVKKFVGVAPQRRRSVSRTYTHTQTHAASDTMSVRSSRRIVPSSGASVASSSRKSFVPSYFTDRERDRDGDGSVLEANEFDDDVEFEMDAENGLQDAASLEAWISSILSLSMRESGGASRSMRRNSISPFSGDGGASSALERDYSEILCHMVRKNYCETVIDLVSRAFPCIFRLSCDVISANLVLQQQASNAATPNPFERSSALARSGKYGASAATPAPAPASAAPLPNKTLRGSGVSPSRLLATSLSLCAESVSQAVNGLQATSSVTVNADGTRSVFSLSSDLTSMLQELESFIASLSTQFAGLTLRVDFADFLSGGAANRRSAAVSVSNAGLPPLPPPVSPAFSPSAGQSLVPSLGQSAIARFQELLQSSPSQSVSPSTAALRHPLLQPFHGDCLQSVFALFEGLETMMQAAHKALTGSETALSSVNIESSKASGAALLFGGSLTATLTARSKIKDFNDLDFNSTSSPYHDTMVAFGNLAKEGESQVAQRILDKIFDRSLFLSDVFLSDASAAQSLSLSQRDLATRNSVVGAIGAFSLARDGVGEIDAQERGVEIAIVEWENLLVRGITALKARLKRPDWSSAIVYEHLVQRILSSFVERLRRKCVWLEDSKGFAVTTNSATSITAEVTTRSRKRSMASRLSMHQSQLVLQSLEEELRCCETGWERDLSQFERAARIVWHGEALSSDGSSSGNRNNNKLRNKTRHSEWIDCLRGLVRLRTFSIPKVLRFAARFFPLDFSLSLFAPTATTSLFVQDSPAVNSASSASSASAQGTTSSASLLNRLFAADTTAESASSSSSSAVASLFPSANPVGAPVGVGSSLSKASSAAKAAPPSPSLSIDLSERILSTMTCSLSLSAQQQRRALASRWYHTHTAAGSLLLPLLKEMAALEVKSAQKYVAFRVQSLQATLHAGFASLLRREREEEQALFVNDEQRDKSTPSSPLPAHLSRMLLAVQDEKLSLQVALRELRIETGGGRSEYGSKTVVVASASLSQRETDAGSDNEHDERESSHKRINGSSARERVCAEDNSEEEEEYSNETRDLSINMMSVGVQDALDPRYKHFLYQELCRGCVALYEEMMKKMVNGQFGSNSSPASIPLRTLAQAWEEWEFLKTILRPILPFFNEQVQQQRTAAFVLSVHELDAISTHLKSDSAKPFVRKDELLRSANLFSAMIQ